MSSCPIMVQSWSKKVVAIFTAKKTPDGQAQEHLTSHNVCDATDLGSRGHRATDQNLQVLRAKQRYSPAECVDAVPVIVSGNPEKLIGTSVVERHTLLCGVRFNEFSNKLESHMAATALHFANYNFCKLHASLRETPAMEAGITDHMWTIRKPFSFKLTIRNANPDVLTCVFCLGVAKDISNVLINALSLTAGL